MLIFHSLKVFAMKTHMQGFCMPQALTKHHQRLSLDDVFREILGNLLTFLTRGYISSGKIDFRMFTTNI